MQSFVGALRRSAGADSNPVRVYLVNSFRPLVCISRLNSPGLKPVGLENVGFLPTLSRCLSSKTAEVNTGTRVCNNNNLFLSPLSLSSKSSFDATSSSTFAASSFAKFNSRRYVTTSVNPVEMPSQESSVPAAAADDLPISPRIKFKRLDKTARHIMQILDKEAVTSVKEQREIVDVKPGYIIQMKVESPENKRRISTIKGIVIARRNAGLNTTFRLRRLVAGVGVESLFPLYSPNIKEIKVIDKKKVRRAKLYHLRERMNALRR